MIKSAEAAAGAALVFIVVLFIFCTSLMTSPRGEVINDVQKIAEYLAAAG